MAEYYISSSNLTFSLKDSKILYNEGSGSGVNIKKECTQYWFNNQSDITVVEMLEISNRTSGSRTYMNDRGWM
jgi:hypothetical protein